jgi:hypothetical protein
MVQTYYLGPFQEDSPVLCSFTIAHEYHYVTDYKSLVIASCSGEQDGVERTIVIK